MLNNVIIQNWHSEIISLIQKNLILIAQKIIKSPLPLKLLAIDNVKVETHAQAFKSITGRLRETDFAPNKKYLLATSVGE